MLRTYSSNITATANEPIPFNVDKITRGATITHPSPTNIQVNSPGYYAISLDASFSGTAGLTSIQLYADGVAIPDAIITETLVDSQVTDASFNTIIKASPAITNNNVKLTIVPTTALTITNIAFGINRVIV